MLPRGKIESIKTGKLVFLERKISERENKRRKGWKFGLFEGRECREGK